MRYARRRTPANRKRQDPADRKRLESVWLNVWVGDRIRAVAKTNHRTFAGEVRHLLAEALVRQDAKQVEATK